MASISTKCNLLKIVEGSIGRDKFRKVLDVGCGGNGGGGTDEFLHILANAAYKNIYGLDIEPLKRTVMTPISDDHYFQLDISKSEIPGKYDVITAWEVVEHLENPHHFIREVEKALNDDGYFIISMPNPFHLISRWQFFRHGNMPRWNARNNHITIFTRHLFKKAFLSKFDLIETFYPYGEFQYGKLKYFNGWYPQNQFFGHYVVYVMKKKAE